MLSMFKDKKGFSVLFRNAERDSAAPSLPADIDATVRRSSRVSDTVGRYTGGSDVAQPQCQRCSKRFSASEEDQNEEQSCCRRCGYPTCPQCREPVTGTPPWVCCVCDGPKSFMWLLEKTKMGPRLVSKIVEFCDPRGQRLMRSMLRFTLQQYRAVSSPRPSRTTTHTPGEREAGCTGLNTVSANQGNLHRPSPYAHPKHASLLRPASRLSATEGKAAVVEKENFPLMLSGAVEVSESPRRPHGSEALRRDDAVFTVEYSPEPDRHVREEWEESRAGSNKDSAHPLPPPQQQPILGAEDRCTAVQDIYRASDINTMSRSTLVSLLSTEEASVSPHVRPSGHSAFQREVPHQLPPNNARNKNSDTVKLNAHETEAATLNLDAATMPVASSGQPGRFGRSSSPASSGSCRSESPAPRFPSFAQFLDDRAAVGAGQTHLPRESDVLVTVSPDSSEGGEKRNSNVIELCGTRSSRLTIKSSNNNKGGFRTPRSTLSGTPRSTAASASRRQERRISGLSGDFTPTRVLDLSAARATVRRGSSSRRRSTRGSLAEMPAPHLYCGGGGIGRRSGQIGDSPFMHDLPSQFGGGGGGSGSRVASARGQMRRQHAPLVTRTAGRVLGSGGGGAHDPRARLVRQNSRTVTPLQRTPSNNGRLQRIPSGSHMMARTNSSTAQFARKNSSTTRGAAFGRANSGTAQLTRMPSSRTRLAGLPLSPNGRVQPRTEPTKLARTASASSGLPRSRAEAPAARAALERTQSRYGLVGQVSPLKRTASHVSPGGPSPFSRLNSTSNFTRSATATAGFIRTNSASVFGRGAVAGASSSTNKGPMHQRPHSASSNAFARTATGTYLQSGGGRYGVTPRTRPAGLASRPATVSKMACAGHRDEGGVVSNGDHALTSARKKTPINRAGAASPLHRTNTAMRNRTPTATGGRPPTPTGFTRTATKPRNFERQPSHPLRNPQEKWQRQATGGARTMVDPAPALVGVARRKAAGGAAGQHHVPSAMSRTNSAVSAAATPRTPRLYIISSVSTASTPAAASHNVNSGVHGGGARPVLSSSGASSPQTRSTRTSLTIGRASATRASDGGGMLSPMSTPIVKAPSDAALAGRTSAPRRRPGIAVGGAAAAAKKIGTGPAAADTAGGRSGGTFTRLGTGTRSGTVATNGASREARTRINAAPSPGNFTRFNSRPVA
ncbi:hypothetical protein ABL78_0260 [Leptomonas seymouri]|uniref:FYVE-type domain-containing protein n=1 Tax=Leptomonas seymouri TaxID=5684 RepID=A0A0N1PFF5_LEPSE|nr:hypothetical protein ABL78_0260 [Leptomonas seymouri]|eukprot:KPI90664.1 hypothetical protein ABL78_0260 [Leptomonas seymouri]